MRIFLLCRGYPGDEDLYNYPFLHRRAVWYRTMGHDVQVFVLASEVGLHKFDGSDVITGGTVELQAAITGFAPDCIAAHAIADDMWSALATSNTKLPILGWSHGSEFIPIYKTSFPDTGHPKRVLQKATHQRRIGFWREMAANWPENLKIVFVSDISQNRAAEIVGAPVPEKAWGVIHNPIDTQLFDYREKHPDDRFKVLSIRPFNNWTYANDLSAAAILEMSTDPLFEQFTFHIIGDGPLFEQNLAPIAHFKNVTLEKRFLTQAEISEHHRENGVFLVPTRDDAQGVSRDEAMSSGLVPVTNAVGAVPEFVDPDCGWLLPRDDAHGLAVAMLEMARHPALFTARSKRAAARVRAQSSADIIIAAELALMAGGGFDG